MRIRDTIYEQDYASRKEWKKLFSMQCNTVQIIYLKPPGYKSYNLKVFFYFVFTC